MLTGLMRIQAVISTKYHIKTVSRTPYFAVTVNLIKMKWFHLENRCLCYEVAENNFKRLPWSTRGASVSGVGCFWQVHLSSTKRTAVSNASSANKTIICASEAGEGLGFVRKKCRKWKDKWSISQVKFDSSRCLYWCLPLEFLTVRRLASHPTPQRIYLNQKNASTEAASPAKCLVWCHSGPIQMQTCF